jgi:hypothetical protein
MVVNMKSTGFWTVMLCYLAYSYKIMWVKEPKHERLQSRKRKEFRNNIKQLDNKHQFNRLPRFDVIYSSGYLNP